MLRREEHRAPVRRGPIPRERGVGAETKNSAENDVAGNQSGNEGEDGTKEEAEVSRQKRTCSAVVSGFAEIPVSNQGFDQRKYEKNPVDEIDVDHQSCTEAEQKPLQEATPAASAFPIPEEES